MIKWIKNKLSQDATADDIEENIPPVAVRVNPADTYVDGYNVDESETVTKFDHYMSRSDCTFDSTRLFVLPRPDK
jgi:hypothetical protein